MITSGKAAWILTNKTVIDSRNQEDRRAIIKCLHLLELDTVKMLIPNEYNGGICPNCRKVSYSFDAIPEHCQCGQRLRGDK